MTLYAEQKARRLARAAADPSVIPHGTPSGYNHWGCHCEACTSAASDRWAANAARWNGRRNKVRKAARRARAATKRSR